MVELFESSNTTKKELKKLEAKKLRWSVKWGNSYREGLSSKKVRTAGNRCERKAMIDTQHALLLRHQSALLEVNHNRLKPKRAKIIEEDHKIILHLDEIHFKYCHMGQRNLIHELRDRGYEVGRKRVRRLMRLLGKEAMIPKPNISKRGNAHKIYIPLSETLL